MLKFSLSYCKPISWQVYYGKVTSFLSVSQLLHLLAIFGFSIFWIFLEKKTEMSSSRLAFRFYLAMGIEGFLILIFSQRDGYGRYHNFKQIKEGYHFYPVFTKEFIQNHFGLFNSLFWKRIQFTKEDKFQNFYL